MMTSEEEMREIAMTFVCTLVAAFLLEAANELVAVIARRRLLEEDVFEIMRRCHRLHDHRLLDRHHLDLENLEPRTTSTRDRPPILLSRNS